MAKRIGPIKVHFVTGTRAEFGLMLHTLRRLAGDARFDLKIIATGQHLSVQHGKTLKEVADAELGPVAVVKWPSGGRKSLAICTGEATVGFTKQFEADRPDWVLVVGDRVEPFAAAVAAHLSGVRIAHVHGGDRALGQVDDSLRHAITKLSHLHLAAYASSYERLLKLGEDKKFVKLVGPPGLESARIEAASVSAVKAHFGDVSRAAVILQHPVTADDREEGDLAGRIIRAVRDNPMITRLVMLGPNADPGYHGIIRMMIGAVAAARRRYEYHPHLSRPLFLGLLRDCRVLVGNSSSGLIETTAFAQPTPVLNVGPRQSGREAGANVVNCATSEAAIRAGLKKALSPLKIASQPKHLPTAKLIADALASKPLPPVHKLISY